MKHIIKRHPIRGRPRWRERERERERETDRQTDRESIHGGELIHTMYRTSSYNMQTLFQFVKLTISNAPHDIKPFWRATSKRERTRYDSNAETHMIKRYAWRSRWLDSVTAGVLNAVTLSRVAHTIR